MQRVSRKLRGESERSDGPTCVFHVDAAHPKRDPLSRLAFMRLTSIGVFFVSFPSLTSCSGS